MTVKSLKKLLKEWQADQHQLLEEALRNLNLKINRQIEKKDRLASSNQVTDPTYQAKLT